MGCQRRVQRGGWKSPSIQAVSVQSSAARTGGLGIKFRAAPPGTARAGGHRPWAPSAGRGRGVVGLVIDDQNLAARDHQAVDLPGHQRRRLPGRSSRPTIETSARLPAAKAARTAVGDQRQTCLPKRAPFVLGPAVGVAGEIAKVRPRGAARARYRAAIAAAGAPACRAVSAFCALRSDSPAAAAMAVVIGRIGWPQQAVRGDVRWRRRAQPGRQHRSAPLSRRCGAVPAADILRPRIAFHHAAGVGRSPAAAGRNASRPLSIRSYQEQRPHAFRLPGMQPPTIRRSAARVIAT